MWDTHSIAGRVAGRIGMLDTHSFDHNPDKSGCPRFMLCLENGGSLETAAHIAAHESPRTTKLYDRTAEAITLEEIERIRF